MTKIKSDWPECTQKLVAALPYGWSSKLKERMDFSIVRIRQVIYAGNEGHDIWKEALKLASEYKKQKEKNKSILNSL